MNELIAKLRIFLRAEITLFKADARRRSNRVMFMAVALACFLVALSFVNVGAFFMLTDADTEARAAFTLAVVNMLVAIIPAFLARNIKPGPEEDMVREIREMALDEINRDVESVSKEVAAIGNSVKQVRDSFSMVGSSSLPALGSLLPLLINLLKKKG